MAHGGAGNGQPGEYIERRGRPQGEISLGSWR